MKAATVIQVRLRRYALTLRLVTQNASALFAVCAISFMAILGVIAPFISPFDPEVTDFSRTFIPPGSVHILGTDAYGRDVLSVIIWGARTDLFVAVIVVCGAAALGAVIGLASGYLGGMVDRSLSYVVDVFMALPSLILAMAFAVVLGRNFVNLSIALILASWPIYARLIRSVVLQEKQQTYVQAAKTLGFSNRRIALVHILPNSWYPIIIQSTLELGRNIMRVASLSFIGFGFPVLTPEWGAILTQGLNYLFSAPWVVLYPSIFIFVTVLAFNLLGDSIRDILDPRLRLR
jgi:peptide/nickel transport system permease protein